MKLKIIEIGNYKQFRHSVINLEKGITVLAGANNSGKTSLIDLLRNILSSHTSMLSIDDLPVGYAKKLSGMIFKITSKLINDRKNLEEFNNDIIDFLKKIIKHDRFIGIYTNMEITYDKDENISEFADYLMDLRENIYSFYFRFEYTFHLPRLMKVIKSKYAIFSQEILEVKKLTPKSKGYQDKRKKLERRLLEYFLESFEPFYYFTDSKYDNKIKMDRIDFIRLFNFHCINANKRITDDATNKEFSISKEMVDYISNDEEWKNLIQDLPNQLRTVIEEEKIKDEIQEKSLKGLEKAIEEISKTNGGSPTKMNLDLDISEETILSFIKTIIRAQYLMEDFTLNEFAQGLGYSNLILIHLRLERFVQNLDASVVNLFIIEEPEVHMHPQMQKVFIEYLYTYYKIENIQGIITTHSTEIVKVTKMEKMRVIRQRKLLENKIYDLRDFSEKLDGGESNLRKFYSLFFNLNLSDLIFADRAIFYEGDTERMYIQSLIANTDKNDEENHIFQQLSNLYVAFIQVGGAHAHRYKRILDFLHIKTVIFTDIDYEKEYVQKEDILQSTITNSALNQFYKEEINESGNPTVENLLKWLKEREIGLIKIQTQGSKDYFGRTLEEGMISKFMDKGISVIQSKEFWEEFKKDNKLEFSIPRKNNSTIRDIVNSTGNSKKTDFMYSVINEKKCFAMLPNYIKEGLMWLQQE